MLDLIASSLGPTTKVLSVTVTQAYSRSNQLNTPFWPGLEELELVSTPIKWDLATLGTLRSLVLVQYDYDQADPPHVEDLVNVLRLSCLERLVLDRVLLRSKGRKVVQPAAVLPLLNSIELVGVTVLPSAQLFSKIVAPSCTSCFVHLNAAWVEDEPGFHKLVDALLHFAKEGRTNSPLKLRLGNDEAGVKAGCLQLEIVKANHPDRLLRLIASGLAKEFLTPNQSTAGLEFNRTFYRLENPVSDFLMGISRAVTLSLEEIEIDGSVIAECNSDAARLVHHLRKRGTAIDAVPRLRSFLFRNLQTITSDVMEMCRSRPTLERHQPNNA
ncbi:hypothetical protein FRC00_009874 [Tulasnella sp. 408]|nr:hypothetical protein FRC00_009874 [Tulasnella sp. 408]